MLIATFKYMLFQIKRESSSEGEDPSVIGAFRSKQPNWRVHTCSEEYFDKHYRRSGGLWKSKGSDHKTINNGEWIARREGDYETWVIEINTLEELLALSKGQNEKVTIYAIGLGLPRLEIYDECRE